MGEQIDMIDSMYEKENQELLIAKNVQRSYRNLSYIRDIIYATSLRFPKTGAISVNKKLAYAAENIHYSIFHMCEFLYRETRELKEYRYVSPMSLLDDIEQRVNAGNLPGRPLEELMTVWDDSVQVCRNAIRIATKALKDHKSIIAADYFIKSAREVRQALKDAYMISEGRYYCAL